MVAQAGSGASPICPPGAIRNTNVTVKSNNNYLVINDGPNDVFVDVVAEVKDDKGNHNRVTRTNLRVAANTEEKEDLHPSFNAAYATAGAVLVTSTTTVSGAATSATKAQCTFNVT